MTLIFCFNNLLGFHPLFEVVAVLRS